MLTIRIHVHNTGSGIIRAFHNCRNKQKRDVYRQYSLKDLVYDDEFIEVIGDGEEQSDDEETCEHLRNEESNSTDTEENVNEQTSDEESNPHKMNFEGFLKEETSVFYSKINFTIELMPVTPGFYMFVVPFEHLWQHMGDDARKSYTEKNRFIGYGINNSTFAIKFGVTKNIHKRMQVHNTNFKLNNRFSLLALLTHHDKSRLQTLETMYKQF
eukprot:Pgem_evm1s18640